MQQTFFATNSHITCEESLFFTITSRIFCNKLNSFNFVMETSFITIVDLFYEDSSLFDDHNEDFCYERLKGEHAFATRTYFFTISRIIYKCSYLFTTTLVLDHMEIQEGWVVLITTLKFYLQIGRTKVGQFNFRPR